MLEELRNVDRWMIRSHQRKTPIGTPYRLGDAVLVDHGPNHPLPVTFYLVVRVEQYHVSCVDLATGDPVELTCTTSAISDIIPPEQVPPALWPKVVAWRLTHDV